MINLLCEATNGAPRAIEVWGLIFSVLGVFANFGGAWLGAYLGYKYAIKSQKEEKKEELNSYLEKLINGLDEFLSESAQDNFVMKKILNFNNIELISIPIIDQIIQNRLLSTDQYSEIKRIKMAIDRINQCVFEKRELFNQFDEETKRQIKDEKESLLKQDKIKDGLVQLRNKIRTKETECKEHGEYYLRCHALFNSVNELNEELTNEIKKESEQDFTDGNKSKQDPADRKYKYIAKEIIKLRKKKESSTERTIIKEKDKKCV